MATHTVGVEVSLRWKENSQPSVSVSQVCSVCGMGEMLPCHEQRKFVQLGR